MACETPKTISQQLRQAIDASGMSRYRICKEIGLPESTMSHFMAGDCGLALATVDRLGKLLGLSITAGPGGSEAPRGTKPTPRPRTRQTDARRPRKEA